MLNEQYVLTHQPSLTVCVESNHFSNKTRRASPESQQSSSFATKLTMSAEAGFYTKVGQVPLIYLRRLFRSLP